MKRIIRISGILIIFCVMGFATASANLESENGFDALSTTISHLEWEVDEDWLSIYPDHTTFAFQTSYAIYNPNPVPIALNFSDTKQFALNMTLLFENTSIPYHIYRHGAFCAITSRIIEPGYTLDETSGITLIVHNTSIDQMPDGVYNFWVEDYHRYAPDIDIIYNKTIITIEDGIATVVYPDVIPSPSITNSISLNLSAFLIIPILLLRKKSIILD